MTCSLSDILKDGSGNPLRSRRVTLEPVTDVLLVDTGSGYEPAIDPWPVQTTDSSGAFTIAGYRPSQCAPSTMQFVLSSPGLFKIQGRFPELSTVTLQQLVDSYGWVTP